ncbi:hypothetical protein Ahy_B10g106430 isoform B [Arachis hypogaea]|uniref:Uncharacterized protein n=1 Tax=Arachis hypogaea TaxID=3818 RepID=A0A444XAT6_ARAHY|nr:hypothetical protein Ahy_B10g106430 isoform B [Arachis hypogaea]
MKYVDQKVREIEATRRFDMLAVPATCHSAVYSVLCFNFNNAAKTSEYLFVTLSVIDMKNLVLPQEKVIAISFGYWILVPKHIAFQLVFALEKRRKKKKRTSCFASEVVQGSEQLRSSGSEYFLGESLWSFAALLQLLVPLVETLTMLYT